MLKKHDLRLINALEVFFNVNLLLANIWIKEYNFIVNCYW